MAGPGHCGEIEAAAGQPLVLLIIARGDLRNLLAVRFSAGDGWIVICAVAWTAYSVLLKRWQNALSPLAQLAAVIAGGIVVLLPFTLLESLLLAPLPASAMALLLVVLAALLPGVLSYGAYSLLQSEFGASRTALMLYLGPVYGALLGWILLGEVPGWHHALGVGDDPAEHCPGHATMKRLTACLLLVLARPAFAHDSWFAPLPSPYVGEVRLALGTFPHAQETQRRAPAHPDHEIEAERDPGKRRGTAAYRFRTQRNLPVTANGL